MRRPAAPRLLLGLSLVTAACAGQIDAGPDGDDGTIPVLCGNGAIDPGESCDDGSNADGDGCSAACATEASPRLDLSIDRPQIATELLATTLITATLQASGGFSGDAEVSATVVDDAGTAIPDWAVALDRSTVTLDPDGVATVVATLKVPSASTAVTGTVKFAVRSDAEEGAFETASAVTTSPVITLVAAVDPVIGQCTYPNGAQNTAIRAGTKVRVLNTSDRGVTVHWGALGGPNPPPQIPGFNHQNNNASIAKDQTYEVTAGINASAGQKSRWYCHSPGPDVAMVFEIVP